MAPTSDCCSPPAFDVYVHVVGFPCTSPGVRKSSSRHRHEAAESSPAVLVLQKSIAPALRTATVCAYLLQTRWRLTLSQAPFPYSVSACVHPAFQTDQRGYQTFRSVNFFCRFHFLFSVYILISFLSAELQRSSQDSWNRGFRGSFVSVSQCRDGQFLCSVVATVL